MWSVKTTGVDMQKISVIIPAYNVNSYIAETCASVQRQSYTHWECIIIDDGSTDDTYATVAKISKQDARFQILQQANAGVSVARNTGIAYAQGQYVAFLDGDDLWAENTLELYAKTLDTNPQCALVWTDAIRFDSRTQKNKPMVWKNYLATGNPWYDMLIYHFIPISGVCVRHAILTRDYYFRTDLTHAEDRDFLLTFLRDHEAMPVGATLLRSRLHPASASHNAHAALQGELRVMEKHLTDPTIPPRIRQRARSALAFRCAVIAAFAGRDYALALRWYAKALARDPLNINNYLLPLQKIFSCFVNSK